MKRRIWIFAHVLILVLLAGPVMGQSPQDLETVDELIDEERPEEAIAMLETLLGGASGPGRAEVLWRLSSATLMRGDQRKDAGASDEEILAIHEEGESWGTQAIAADADNHLGYYWKSANIGRWGQTKGVLNSLFRAPEMRDLLTEAVNRTPEHADSYYVLGQLYAAVPGVVSFGNVEYAVSLGRKSVDLMEAELRSGERDEASEGFYIQLASHLIDRDWNARKRSRSMGGIRSSYRNANTPIDQGFYYEGSASLADEDDHDEAARILDEVIQRLQNVSNPTPSETRLLGEARELRGSI
jgi:tetratricopeptide (TPR) repeat protein